MIHGFLAFVILGKLIRGARASSFLRFAGGLCSAPCLEFLGSPAIFVDPHGDISQNAIIDSHATFQLGDLSSRSFNLEQDKRPLILVQDLVSQLALTHGFRFVYDATLVSDQLFEVICKALNFSVVRYRIGDENHLVLSMGIQTSLLLFRLPIADCQLPISLWPTDLDLWEQAPQVPGHLCLYVSGKDRRPKSKDQLAISYILPLLSKCHLARLLELHQRFFPQPLLRPFDRCERMKREQNALNPLPDVPDECRCATL